MAPNRRMVSFLGRAKRALGDQEIPDLLGKLRAIVGADIPASETKAHAAWIKLRDGHAPDPDELAALEIVIRLLRPAPLSHAGALDDLPDQGERNLYPQELKDQWSTFRTTVQPLLYSIGRVNLKDGTQIGTGFLVADHVLATNRHVLDDLTDGTEALRPGEAVVDFQGEDGAKDEPDNVVPINGVIRVHETFDMALLEVPATGRPVPVLDAASPAEGLRVAAIGYPSTDRKRNPLFMDTVFGNRFGVKRAALGEVLDGSDGPDLFHDCSTLGGNSGSPLFSLKTGHVVGIHKGGFFMFRNEAVDASELHPFVMPGRKRAVARTSRRRSRPRAHHEG